MANVTIQGEKRLQKILAQLPRELTNSIKGAARTVGDRYVTHHRKARMRAAVNKSGQRRPIGEGIRATAGKEGRPGLLKTFAVKLFGTTLSNLKLKIWTPNIIALQHEIGATLFPRKGKYMAIPMAAAQTGGRTSKVAARLRSQRRLIVVRARSGKVFLARPATAKDRRAGKSRLTFLFHLVKKTQLQPRLKFRETWRGWSKTNAMKLWAAGLSRALSAARRKAGR